MAGRRCPHCGRECAPGASFCTDCGGRLMPRPARPEVAREPDYDEPRGAAAVLWWFLNLFPGLVRPGALVMSLICLPVAAAVAWLGLFVTAMGAVVSGLFIAGFGMVIYWSAVAWLIYGYVCLPSEALAEFDSRQWSVMLLLGLAPVALGLYWMGTHG